MSDESGMETVEWAILAGVMLAGLIPILTLVGANVSIVFGKVKTGTASP